MSTLASIRHVVVKTIPDVRETSSKDPKMLVYGPSPYSGYKISHPSGYPNMYSYIDIVTPDSV